MSKTTPIRDAATVALIRYDGLNPRILMGQRGNGAVFMPNKFVFPGGTLDEDDIALSAAPDLTLDLPSTCAKRLSIDCVNPYLGIALGLTAIRETFEETGLCLGTLDAKLAQRSSIAPEGWRDFLARGLRPNTQALSFIFRAITPPNKTRRFDARFFLADCSAVASDLDDFSEASGELTHLQWLTLEESFNLDLPFVTSVVLAEIQSILLLTESERQARPVPMFTHPASGPAILPL